MRKRIGIVMVLGLFSLMNATASESPVYWAENPGASVIFDENKSENVVGIFLHEKYDYHYDSDGDLVYLHTMHRRFRLNNDEAVNNFNKFSVWLSNVLEVKQLQARVIKPGGEVVEFDQEGIKELIDEDSGNRKIFTVDGIETGDDIEYIIVRLMQGGNFGRVFLQFDYPLQEASFELISPSNLFYAAKGYNGFPCPAADTTADGRNRLYSSITNMAALKEYAYSYYQPRRARIEYKLEYNHSRDRAKLLTWDDASRRVYEMMYDEVNPKSVNKWLKTIKVKEGSALQKASQVEDYIKTNIFHQEYNKPEFNDLDFINTHKVSGPQGIVRLYANLFKALGIEHEIVLTSDRSDIRMDPDFESWNYLENYLIYLPAENLFIEPGSDLFRIGCFDGNFSNTHGLFIKTLAIGSFESGVGNVRFIEPLPYNFNYDNMNIEIDVDVENAEVRIRNTRGFKGLSGGSLGRLYQLIDEDLRQDLLKDLMETKAPDPRYNTLKVLPATDIDFIRDAGFLIFADFHSSSFVQLAGNSILLNFGESIGPQVELYYDEERTIGAESGFNRWYYRRIIFRVPNGYRIANPEAADMNVVERQDDEDVFAFISTHSYSGNIFTVDIDEYYKNIEVDPSQFEGFRKVVNAAADFNKVVLVLEKVND